MRRQVLQASESVRRKSIISGAAFRKRPKTWQINAATSTGAVGVEMTEEQSEDEEGHLGQQANLRFSWGMK